VAPDGSQNSDSAETSTSADMTGAHRRHVADADDIDWQAHPRLERKMRKLYVDLAKTSRELAQIKRALAAQASDGGPVSLQVQSYSQQAEQLRAKRRRLQEETAAIMVLIDPDVSGTLLDRVKSKDTREAENDFVTVWKDYQRSQKASWSKYLWTVASGTFAYSIPFGTATMASKATGLPWLVPVIAGPLHTLFEPFWTSIRSVTWTNPNVDALILRQRVRARDAGDAFRRRAGRQPKRKFIVPSPDGGEPAVVTAREFLRQGNSWRDWSARTCWPRGLDCCGLLNWIDKVGWLHWADKVFTDDMPFFVFFLLYSLKNGLVEWMGMDFYDHQSRSSILFNYYGDHHYDGMLNDLGLQFLAGMLSGSLTMLISQAMRRRLAKTTGGREVVTKSLHVWKLEAKFLRSYIRDIDGEVKKNNAATPRSKRAHKDAFLLEQKKKELEGQLATCEAKSGILSGLWYDMGVMWQGKRRAVGTGPDMSGKRLDTVCSILGRSTSLMPGMAVSYLVAPYQGFTCRCVDPVTRVMRHIAAPLALITWPAFAARLELQGAYRVVFGAMKGAYSACTACCRGEDDEGDEDYEGGDAGGGDSPGAAAIPVPRTTAARRLFADAHEDEPKDAAAQAESPGKVAPDGTATGKSQSASKSGDEDSGSEDEEQDEEDA
jgi:hypothetical protein